MKCTNWIVALLCLISPANGDKFPWEDWGEKIQAYNFVTHCHMNFAGYDECPLALEAKNPSLSSKYPAWVLVESYSEGDQIYSFDFSLPDAPSFARGGYSRKINSRKLSFFFEDINLDENPELIFSLKRKSKVNTYIVSRDQHIVKYKPLLEKPIILSLSGRVVIGDWDRKRQGKELLCYEPAGKQLKSSKLIAKFFAWDKKSHRFTCYRKIVTRRVGTAGLKELGL